MIYRHRGHGFVLLNELVHQTVVLVGGLLELADCVAEESIIVFFLCKRIYTHSEDRKCCCGVEGANIQPCSELRLLAMSGARRRGVRLPGLTDSPGNGASPRSNSPDVALDSQDDDPVRVNLAPRGTFDMFKHLRSLLCLLLSSFSALYPVPILQMRARLSQITSTTLPALP